ncbi:hypothetical protein RYX36_037220 [Vicia faba]
MAEVINLPPESHDRSPTTAPPPNPLPPHPPPADDDLPPPPLPRRRDFRDDRDFDRRPFRGGRGGGRDLDAARGYADGPSGGARRSKQMQCECKEEQGAAKYWRTVVI